LKKRDPANLVVDIIVTNGQIRALRPIYDVRNPIPHTEPEKSNWLKTHANTDRIQKRILGNLGKTSLNRARRFVSYSNNNNNSNNSNNNHQNNNNNGNNGKEYGSILAFEEDFVRLI
jgi:hypothetical protein